MKQKLAEGLDYRDLVNQLIPQVSIDEYAAKMGSDDDIVTLSFIVKGNQVGNDLVEWFERGYDWILDAQTSDGEISPGKYLVFVELDRRSTVPDRVVQLVEDLETLTDLKLEDWKVVIDGEKYDLDPSVIKSNVILSPHLYREKHGTEDEEDLNEMRNLSGIAAKKKHKEPDNLLKDFVAKAGL